MFVVSEDAKVTALRCPTAPATTAHVMPIILLTSVHLTTSVPTDASVHHPIVHAVILPLTSIQIVLLNYLPLTLYHPLHRLHSRTPFHQIFRFHIQVINSLVTKISD